MFNVIFITDDNNTILRNNIEKLLNSDIECDIYVVNNGKKSFNLLYDVNYSHYYSNNFEGVNQLLKKIIGDVVLIEKNHSIDKHFLSNLKSNYDPDIINMFRVDIINNRLISTDKSIGKSLSHSDIRYNMAFNTKVINHIDINKNNFFDYCNKKYIKILLKPNIRVFLHETPIKKVFKKRLPLDRPTKSDKSIDSLYNFNSSIKSINKQIDIIDKIPQQDLTYSIIIPFMYNGDRFPLFEACIKCLYEHTKNYNNIEIIVHETAPERYLTSYFIKKYQLKYMYSEWDEVFHCAWALNVPAKHIAKGNIFVFFDADLIITDEWVNELLLCDTNNIYIGWNKIYYCNNKSTNYYLKYSKISNEFLHFLSPSADWAAGGINIIPKHIHLEVNGWDESFNKYYGGADNTFWYKLMSFGYNYKIFKTNIYHLYHKHRTVGNENYLHNKFDKFKKYNKQDWLNYFKTTDWGKYNDTK